MYERLLEFGSAELPSCTCGQEMGFLKTRNISSDAAIKHFECAACGHELRITVWPESVVSHHMAL